MVAQRRYGLLDRVFMVELRADTEPMPCHFRRILIKRGESWAPSLVNTVGTVSAVVCVCMCGMPFLLTSCCYRRVGYMGRMVPVIQGSQLYR